jgi:DNA-binding FadR family transcriptional regulator
MPASRLAPQRIRDHVAELIAGGRYAPGDRLPTERMLADTLPASRNAVRDGLAMLAADGVVRRVAGSGTYVAAPPAAGGSAWSPRLSSPSEIMAARLAIEPQLVRLAALHAAPTEIDALDALQARMAADPGSADFESLDAALHAGIAAATRNRLLDHLYREITAARDQALWGELKKRSATAANRLTYVGEHAAILAAIRRRDPVVAAEAAAAHLRSVRGHLLGD